jgi:hypothetical protein
MVRPARCQDCRLPYAAAAIAIPLLSIALILSLQASVVNDLHGISRDMEEFLPSIPPRHSFASLSQLFLGMKRVALLCFLALAAFVTLCAILVGTARLFGKKRWVAAFLSYPILVLIVGSILPTGIPPVWFYLETVTDAAAKIGLTHMAQTTRFDALFEIIQLVYLLAIYCLHANGVAVVMRACEGKLSASAFLALHRRMLWGLYAGAAVLACFIALLDTTYTLPASFLGQKEAEAFRAVAAQWSEYYGMFNSLIIAIVWLPPFLLFRRRLGNAVRDDNPEASDRRVQEWLKDNGFQFTWPKATISIIAIAAPSLAAGSFGGLLRSLGAP